MGTPSHSNMNRRDFMGAAAGSGLMFAASGADADEEGKVMNAYEIGDQTGIDTLRLVERPAPKPGRGDVVIKVHASALNARDLRIIRHAFP
jgi:hypothetical protein